MQFKKRIICAAALVSLPVLMFTGCSDGRRLSEKELADVLSKSLGETVEITGKAEEKYETVVYSMKCAEGTDFTVKRLHLQHNYFGDRYYKYECDYLVNWVHDHPELNAVNDEQGISRVDFDRGTRLIARDFEEIPKVVEAACALVEDDANRIPAVSDLDGDYVLEFERPVVAVDCLDGKNDDGTWWLWEEFEYQDGTETVDHDEELEIFLAEREYVDKVRDGHIEASLPDELLEKYGPGSLKIMLMNSERYLYRDRSRGEDLPMGKPETLYYISDCSNTQKSETLDFPDIASWSACTGFAPYAADSESYTLARGAEKVVFHFPGSECYAERDGVRVALRGKMEQSEMSCNIYLTTGDLTKLFDTEFQFDYINGTAEITNKKT